MPEQISRHEGRHLFGLNPQDYEDVRPDYPAWIFDYLRELGALINGTTTLEIGAGTGKATRQLLAYGANPLTIIEPDKRFAAMLSALTKASSTTCEILYQAFEEAVLPEHEFDLAVAATAFHWIEPLAGLRKIKRLLKPHGCAALCWNLLGDASREDAFHDATCELLASLATGPAEAPGTVPFPLDLGARQAEARAAGFDHVDYRESRWSLVLNTADVGKLYASFSHIQRLEADTRAALLDKLMNIAEVQFNGRVVRNVISCLHLFS